MKKRTKRAKAKAPPAGAAPRKKPGPKPRGGKSPAIALRVPREDAPYFAAVKRHFQTENTSDAIRAACRKLVELLDLELVESATEK